jgi:hypothetical protein
MSDPLSFRGTEKNVTGFDRAVDSCIVPMPGPEYFGEGNLWEVNPCGEKEIVSPERGWNEVPFLDMFRW